MHRSDARDQITLDFGAWGVQHENCVRPHSMHWQHTISALCRRVRGLRDDLRALVHATATAVGGRRRELRNRAFRVRRRIISVAAFRQQITGRRSRKCHARVSGRPTTGIPCGLLIVYWRRLPPRSEGSTRSTWKGPRTRRTSSGGQGRRRPTLQHMECHGRAKRLGARSHAGEHEKLAKRRRRHNVASGRLDAVRRWQ